MNKGGIQFGEEEEEDETREIGWGLPGGPVKQNPFSKCRDIGLTLVRGLRSQDV